MRRMQEPGRVTFNREINLANIISFVGLLSVVAGGLWLGGDMQATIRNQFASMAEKDEESKRERAELRVALKSTEEKSAERMVSIDKRLSPLERTAESHTYQIGDMRGTLTAFIDRTTKNFEVNRDRDAVAQERFNKLSTSIEVMGSKLDSLTKVIEQREAGRRAQPPLESPTWNGSPQSLIRRALR